jgi:hypothetical protein
MTAAILAFAEGLGAGLALVAAVGLLCTAAGRACARRRGDR